MQETMPMRAKHAAVTELHSMKCSWTDAIESVDTDATVAKNIADAMNIQYRVSNFTSLT
jgi:hypothetical protein